MEKTKFKYTPEYQWDLLRYIILDNNGVKALSKIKDYYFTLIEHQVIALALINYFKKNQKIPGETILRENIVQLLNSKDYVKLVTKDEQDDILRLIPKLYTGLVRDADEIYSMTKKWSAYVRIKDLLERIDPRNWEDYNRYSNEFQNAIEDEDEQNDRQSSFLLRSVSERQVRRRENKGIYPTPFKQINKLTNADGYEGGSILVLLDKQKKGKTAALVNIARGYLRLGKKILYLDYENGKDPILTRFEQSINKLTKEEILGGEFDKKIKSKFRKYQRIGGEIVVERLPAGSTTNDVQRIIDKFYREHGIVFQVIISDYIAKMGSTSGTNKEFDRISEAYVDMANLALRNNIEHIWTANHVTREGAKARMKTCYEGEDIAKCIDIARHAQAIFGLNRTPEEEEAGFIRFEVVEQRDGVSYGRAVFTMDHTTQHMQELNKSERSEYDDIFSNHNSDETPNKKSKSDSDFKP